MHDSKVMFINFSDADNYGRISNDNVQLIPLKSTYILIILHKL